MVCNGKPFFRHYGCGLALLVGLTGEAASAVVLDFDGVTLANPSPVHTFPSPFTGPTGFNSGGFHFSDNSVIGNIEGIPNGPAHSGRNALINSYAFTTNNNVLYDATITVTRIGGGDFAFKNLFLQSWTYPSHNPNPPDSGETQGAVYGLKNGVITGVKTYERVLTWTEVSATGTGVGGSFDDIYELRIVPTLTPIKPNYLTLVDDLQVTPVSVVGAVPGVPELATWAMLLTGLAGLGLARRFAAPAGALS